MQHRIQRGHYVFSGKWFFTGRHLIQHYTKRKNVAPRVEAVAACLLRGHVHGSARNHPYRSQRIFDWSVGLGSHRFVVRQLGQPEVQNLCLSVFRQKNIRRLNVTVDDAFGV